MCRGSGLRHARLYSLFFASSVTRNGEPEDDGRAGDGPAGDGRAEHETNAILDGLLATSGRWDDKHNTHVANLPLNIAAEVQLIYAPYLEQGRKLSHLLYKIFRCLTESELARDAGGKRREGRAGVEAAERACMAIVERVRAERGMGA